MSLNYNRARKRSAKRRCSVQYHHRDVKIDVRKGIMRAAMNYLFVSKPLVKRDGKYVNVKGVSVRKSGRGT